MRLKHICDTRVFLLHWSRSKSIEFSNIPLFNRSRVLLFYRSLVNFSVILKYLLDIKMTFYIYILVPWQTKDILYL